MRSYVIQVIYNNFMLGTENEAKFGKFEDASFTYEKDGKTHVRLLQLKHVDEESKKIRYEDLKPKKSKGEKTLSDKYGLTKFFESFINKCPIDVESCTLFTNLEFDANDEILKQLFIEDTTPDDILDVSDRFGGKVPKKWKLDHETLKTTDDLYDLLKTIAEKNMKLDDALASIQRFCKTFIFATGQANNNEIEKVLETEIPRISELPRSELVNAKYFQTFLDWFNNRNQIILTYEDIQRTISLTRLQAENLKRTLEYYEKWKGLTYELTDSTIKKVTKYFDEDNSIEKFVHIFTQFPILTLSKMFQCLKNKGEECLIIEVNNEIDENVMELMKFFKFCVIIFNINIGVPENYKNKFFTILEEIKNKVVIINAVDQQLDDCSFQQLVQDSKKEIISRKITFDDKEVKLSRFGPIDVFEKLEDTTWLSKLVTGKLRFSKKNLKYPEKNCIERKLICSDELLTETDQRLIILSSEAGMGKTTLLLSTSQKIKKSNPVSWTEIIKLTKYDTVFPTYETSNDVTEFLATKILKYDSFTTKIFQHQIKNLNSTVLMFDGFDEILHQSKDAVVSIVHNLLKTTNVRQIWITSRPTSSASDFLKNQFPRPFISLKKFSNDDVIKCFSDHWSDHQLQCNKEKMIELVKYLLQLDKIDFKIPFNAKKTAEFFMPTDCNQELKHEVDLIKLYDFFITKTYLNFLGQKIERNAAGHLAIGPNDRETIKMYERWHKRLALHMLCPERNMKHDLTQDAIEIVNSIGIATVNDVDNNIIHFDHRTIAEYYLAKSLFDKFTDDKCVDDQTLELLFKIDSKFKEVELFLNEFLENSDKVPKKIKTNTEVIANLKKAFINFVTDGKGNFLTIYICLDNIDAIELDKMEYINQLNKKGSGKLFQKYITELKNQFNSKPAKLKEFIYFYIMENARFCENNVIKFDIEEKLLEIFKKLLKDNIYPARMNDENLFDIQKISMTINYLHRNTFIDFCEAIINSNSIDNFLFCIYCLAHSLRRIYTARENIEKHLIEASIGSTSEFDEIGKHLNEIRFVSPNQTFKFYRILIKVFKNQKDAFMKCLDISENVLSYDEFEMLLTENVNGFNLKLEEIVKSLGTFLLSYKYFKFINNSEQINLKPYFKKLKKYNYQELLAVVELIDANTYFEYFVKNEENNRKIFYETIDLSLEQKDCFFKNREIMCNCFAVFAKLIKASNSKSNEFLSKEEDLIKVFDDNPGIYKTLMRRGLEPLLEKTLKLDSLEFLMKIVTVLETVIGITVLYEGENKRFFSKYQTNEKCKDYFKDFVNKFKN